MTAPQASAIVATIAGADLLDRIDKLTEKVGDLARKIDDTPHRMEELRRDADDHETRIRAIERRLWLASGAAGLAGMIIGWIFRVAAHIGGLQ